MMASEDDDIVIDRDGEAWHATSPAYARSLGYPAPDFDLAHYAVLNLGHVRIQRRREGARVFFRPCDVLPVTLAGVFLALGDRPPRRIVLSWDSEREWSDQVLGQLSMALGRMERLVMDARPTGPDFVAAACDPDQLEPRFRAGVVRLVELWNGRRARWRRDLAPTLRRMEARRTTMAARLSPHSERLIIES